MVLPYLLALSRARTMYLGLGMIIYMLYPRFASWQIFYMRFETLSLHWDLSVDIDINIGVTVWNPNLVGAVLLNATLDIYRGHQSDIGHDSYVSHLGEPFAKVTVGRYRVPRRNHFDMMSRISIQNLSLRQSLSLVYEMFANSGHLKVVVSGHANVRAAKQGIFLTLHCLQIVDAFTWPCQIDHSDCRYTMSNALLSDLSATATGTLHPLLHSFVSTFDITDPAYNF